MILKGKNVTLTFPKGCGPVWGVNYMIGDEIPQEHEEYVLLSGGELEPSELPKPKPKKVEEKPKEEEKVDIKKEEE